MQNAPMEKIMKENNHNPNHKMGGITLTIRGHNTRRTGALHPYIGGITLVRQGHCTHVRGHSTRTEGGIALARKGHSTRISKEEHPLNLFLSQGIKRKPKFI